MMSSATTNGSSLLTGAGLSSNDHKQMSFSNNNSDNNSLDNHTVRPYQDQIVRGHTQSEQSLQIPDSPAPQGYLANPHWHVAEEAHAHLAQTLDTISEQEWQNAPMEDGVAILSTSRNLTRSTDIPVFKGRTFIPDCRPIEILAAINLFSYRLIWDTRISSGRILQRYGHHSFSFYCVWRGIGPIYNPRDAIGIQDVRYWGPDGQRQSMPLPDSHRIDLVWRSIDSQDVLPQEGKERMHITLGAYRIQWLPDLNGCQVTWAGEANLQIIIPSYIWKVFAKDLPRTVGRLRGAIPRFGVPSYVVDLQECVVIQTTFYYSESRKTTHRHHVRKPGSYSLMIDRQRMYPFGISPPSVSGSGSDAVTLHEMHDQIVVTVSAAGVGQEYIILIEPRDKENEPSSQSAWW